MEGREIICKINKSRCGRDKWKGSQGVQRGVRGVAGPKQLGMT